MNAKQLGLDSWLGRTEVASGQISQELSDRLRAVIDPLILPPDIVPFGIHWCTALTTVANGRIGADGHPAKGDFLPPVPLPRRMWASSEISFHDHLKIDDSIRRISKVAGISFKDGKSGSLCFVNVDHNWETKRGVAITESQHIVYRDAVTSQSRSASSDTTIRLKENSELPSHSESVSLCPDPALLFRYSALTFNAHRIHYDRDYAVKEEFYPERVVHGPLQATLLMNLAAGRRGPLSRFSFRAMRPAFANASLGLVMGEEADGATLRTMSGVGEVCMEATAKWEESR